MAKNVWDIINSINSGKDISSEDNFKSLYTPFIVNKGLSYFIDTILYAQEMNMNPHLDTDMQYQYFINSIRPKKRFSKWAKKEQNDDATIVKEYYQYNDRKTQSALEVLSPEQIQIIRKKLEKGGR